MVIFVKNFLYVWRFCDEFQRELWGSDEWVLHYDALTRWAHVIHAILLKKL